MEHLALTIFSTCVQMAIGIVVFAAIGRLLDKEAVFKQGIFCAAGLGIVGMLASLLHLGRPLAAFRALYQFDSSWLSREIWLTAIFVGLTVVAALLIQFKSQNKSAVTGVILAAALIGLIDVGAMAAIYSTSSVPYWQGAATFVEFYAAAISMGAVLFLFLSFKETGRRMKKVVALTVAAAVIFQVAVVIPHLVNLAGSANLAIQSSLAILSGMSAATVIKWIGILAGAVLALWLLQDEVAKSAKTLALSSVVLLLAGQVVGRYLFYAAMVVTGIGLA